MPSPARALRRPLRQLLVLGLVVAPTAPVALADSAVRITDLAAGGDDGLSGLDAAVLGNFLYFVGDSGGGEGLYRYDGVNAPALVAGSVAARPRELVTWQGRLYFQGGPSDDRELWEYDPAGPTLAEAVDVRPSGNGTPQRIAAYADEICFGAFSDTQGFELHCWDGVAAPTVHDLASGPDSSYPYDLTPWNGGIAYVLDIDGGTELRFHDGSGSPVEIEPGPAAPFIGPCCLTAGSDGLYFQAEAEDGLYHLFRYAPPAAPALVSTSFEPYGEIGVFRGQAITDGIDETIAVEDPELFRHVAGAMRRVRPGVGVSGSVGHLEHATALYFVAYPSVSSDDRELFKYCGAGGVAPATAAWGAEGESVGTDEPIAWNGKVYVSAYDETFGEELWAVTPSHLFCDDFETGGTASWP